MSDNFISYSGTGISEVFEISELEHIRIAHKTMIFPAILGGIMSPLTLVAGFNGVGNIWLMILLSFIGLLLLYFGFSGTETISVKPRSQREYDIFLFDKIEGLERFVHFANIVIKSGKPISKIFSVLLTEENIQELMSKGEITSESGYFDLAINIPQSQDKKIQYFELIDPIGKGVEIVFRSTETGSKPFLKGAIPLQLVKFNP